MFVREGQSCVSCVRAHCLAALASCVSLSGAAFWKPIAGGIRLLASFESSPCSNVACFCVGSLVGWLSFLAGIEKSKGGTRSLNHLKHVAREGGRVWLVGSSCFKPTMRKAIASQRGLNSYALTLLGLLGQFVLW